MLKKGSCLSVADNCCQMLNPAVNCFQLLQVDDNCYQILTTVVLC